MTQSIQIKILVAILGVLVVITGLLVHGGRPAIQITEQNRKDQKRLEQKVQPSAKPYLEP